MPVPAPGKTHCVRKSGLCSLGREKLVARRHLHERACFLLGLSLQEAFKNCVSPGVEISRTLEQRAEYFRRTQRWCQEGSLRSPGCNASGICSFAYSAAFYKPGTASCYRLADSSHSRKPDSEDKRLLTQASSQVHRDWLPAISTFSRKFLVLFSMSLKLVG